MCVGKATLGYTIWQVCPGHGGVEEPVHAWKIPNARTGRAYRLLGSSRDGSPPGRSANLNKGNAGMNADRKSDGSVVPSTRVNKAATAVAESVEERDLTEGKYCRIGVDAPDSVPDQVSIRASREITTGSDTMCRDRLTRRRSRMSQGSRTDLCGGRLATAVPTAILENLGRTFPSDESLKLGLRSVKGPFEIHRTGTSTE
ncbi:hypothetical protein CA85_08800 [Allorhodopirellula solitaria]|uniref:Uncharacterized protein n=1 Tax=Allorhodopirellula solitaria TaxID=2527987 RepID=A0A5C5YE25_9BACT|nr:hypothetical protein CA85_08800 [Allorhodopirellula solitaria]